jgi:hypothetical protein
MPKRMVRAIPIAAAVLALATSAWAAGALNEGGLAGPGYTPRVPISALGRPLGWFDRSRLQINSSISVGSGFGRSADALQVTRLSYQFGAPLWMAVSVGNSFGSGASRSGQSSFFLEGMDLAYRPHPSVLFQVHYQDLRSPLQLSPFADRGPWGP